jgi:peroxiredoxin
MIDPDSNFSRDDVVAAERLAVAGLVASRAAQSSLRAGDYLPMFVLPDSDGREVDARALIADGPLVVVFLRGVWCPHSNRDAQAVESLRVEIEKRSAAVVSISQQTAQHGRNMKRRNGLGFPLLVDSRGTIAAQFGVRWCVPGYLRESYERIGVDLVRYQGEGWTLPISSMFVTGPGGVIVFAEVDLDFARPLNVASALPVLDRLKISAAG